MSSSPVDPYVGPTSLDAYLDQLRDPHADAAPRTRTPLDGGGLVGALHDADVRGEPAFVCTRPARGAPPRAPSPPTARTRKEQGGIDRRKLQAALEEADLKERPRADFEDMLGKIHPQFGDYDCLTDRQRGYVDNVLQELGVDERSPAERNASVPRGRNVELNFGQLPLAPPGRTPLGDRPVAQDLGTTARGVELARKTLAPGKLSAPRFDASRCAARLGGTEASCLQCGGLCPHPA